MKRQSKQYETPGRGWQGDRISTESTIQEDYGLANKREVWKAQSAVRQFRRRARDLNAEEDEEQEAELIDRLVSLDILDEGAELHEILEIDIDDILERRLQTLVYRRGLAETMKEARQLVSHGHIRVGDRTITIPGYLVTAEEETNISVAPGSESVIED